ncbi:polysaccharide biosynthesis protein [Albibacillus kandeliae]|uniref:hypothetical protein n=1 Tax=Albibacillus kandeliae TaxID=2174228 RepID=UPI0013002394|nr:hypothetical protein [Albibacillus kandeliae]
MTSISTAFRRHGSRAFVFLTGSTLSNLVAAISGLLLARWLSVPDYALYTVMLTLIGAMNVLTKGGAHLGYTAILGRVWPDKIRAAEAIKAVLRARLIISALVLPPIVLGTAWLLRENGAGGSTIIVLCALLVLLWWAEMQTRLVDQILFFAHQTSRVQLLDTALSAFRLGVIVLLYLGDILSVEAAIAIAVLVSFLRIRPILNWVRKLVSYRSATIKDVDALEIRTSVYRQFPVEIYYVFQAQIVLFVISTFASVNEVASYGALSRIAQFLSPLESFTFAFFVPVFARANERLGRILLLMVALISLPGLGLFVMSLVLPEALLWLVGDNYAHLTKEIAMMALLVTFTRASSTLWSLVANKGWVRFSWLQIPLGLIWCAVAPFWIDLSQLSGAMLLQAGFPLALSVAALVDFSHARLR